MNSDARRGAARSTLSARQFGQRTADFEVRTKLLTCDLTEPETKVMFLASEM